VIHGIPINTSYEEILQALDDSLRDQHFDIAYCSQLMSRRSRSGEYLQEFPIAIEQLAHRAYSTIPEEYIRQVAGRAFVDRVEGPDIKIQLLLGGEKVSKAFLQALKLQAVLLVPRPREKSARTLGGSRSPPIRRRHSMKVLCSIYVEPGHFQHSCPYGRDQ
jgi:hypothetical protein